MVPWCDFFIGSVRIRAQAVGIDDQTGERIIYSHDEGEVSGYVIYISRLYNKKFILNCFILSNLFLGCV